MEGADRARRDVLLLALLVEGGLVGLAWGLGWLLGEPPLEKVRWDLAGVGLGLAASVPMLLLFVVLVRWPVGPFRRMKQFFDEVAGPLFRHCTVLDLAVISLLAGAGEEMLFRGVLQAAFTGRLGPAAGLGLASLLFGLMHPITPTYVAVAALIGAYLGWAWAACDNLLVVVVAHAVYDFIALVVLVRGRGNGGTVA
jgi:membrane protease YdiL (CAAX protease family)